MPRMPAWLIAAAAALSAVGAAAQTAAPDVAGDCPTHGVLLDAAALCGAAITSLRPFDRAGADRDATARSRTAPLAALRTAGTATSVPVDGPRPLAVRAQPGTLAVHTTGRQHAARDADSR